MSRRSKETGEWHKPFWRQRGWMVSAVFLAVVAAFAAVSLVVGGGGKAEAGSKDAAAGDRGAKRANGAARTPSAAPAGTDAGRDEPRPAGCSTDDSDKAVPQGPPKDLRWKKIGTSSVPTSKAAGPLTVEGPLWSCFARTPMGAVLAAHVIPAHMSGDDWKEVTEHQVLAGPSRDAFVAHRSDVTASTAPPQQGPATYAGFSVLSWSPDRATVQLLVRGPQGGYGATSVSLRWSGGDWKVAPAADGSLHSPFAPASGTNGFVTWGV
ncbi:hypothetical protein [Wenjunlia tyrosinilytica]|uniref:DUF8175 domain-containing protein n=1 Tax=Wenjunlia tyrosinilytica TaxID=1544741 RepID=A0A918E020_9ACTN|nr:hypothetical protein [Wenjunlia tyrosinilytica]GGO95756.1 hypothetical protein GCM10012280_53690 [Wenjunlia tyrosinilytica]